jgi:hypothetical protein
MCKFVVERSMTAGDLEVYILSRESQKLDDYHHNLSLVGSIIFTPR